MPGSRGISQNRYIDIIKWVFRQNFQDGSNEVSFSRAQLEEAARDLGIEAPKNLGDVVPIRRDNVCKVTKLRKSKHILLLIFKPRVVLNLRILDAACH